MVLHHTQFGVTSLSASKTFYLAALAPLGYKEIFNFGDKQIGLGANGKPDLWLKDVGADGLAVKGLHLAFAAESRQVVDEFYQAALYVISSLIIEELTLNKSLTIFLVYRKAGAKDNGPPGERNYVPGYYAAFVLDLDGNNIEVVHL